jgi:hypothetical protein
MSRRARRQRPREIPAGVHFLKRRDDLVSLMSSASMAKDGRGGVIEKKPIRFGERPKPAP